MCQRCKTCDGNLFHMLWKILSDLLSIGHLHEKKYYLMVHLRKFVFYKIGFMHSILPIDTG